jgi:hypothetical protein
MPFNPNVPADHSPLSSAEMRDQFQAIQNNVDAVREVLTFVQPLGLTVSNPPTHSGVRTNFLHNAARIRLEAAKQCKNFVLTPLWLPCDAGRLVALLRRPNPVRESEQLLPAARRLRRWVSLCEGVLDSALLPF